MSNMSAQISQRWLSALDRNARWVGADGSPALDRAGFADAAIEIGKMAEKETNDSIKTAELAEIGATATFIFGGKPENDADGKPKKLGPGLFYDPNGDGVCSFKELRQLSKLGDDDESNISTADFEKAFGADKIQKGGNSFGFDDLEAVSKNGKFKPNVPTQRPNPTVEDPVPPPPKPPVKPPKKNNYSDILDILIQLISVTLGSFYNGRRY